MANTPVGSQIQYMPENVALHRRCYLCESADIFDKFKVNGYTISGCKSCSFVFVKEHLTTAELVEFYRQMGAPEVYTENENLKNLLFYYERLRDMIEAKQSKGRILDVGCSEGNFLDVMQGWECYGVELEAEVAAKARKKYGDNIKESPLEETDLPHGFFDVISLQDVFDHMPDPLSSLKICYDLLKPGGLIVIKVHNISCLYAKITGSKFYAILPPTHLSYFDQNTLGLALEKSNFSVLSNHFIAHIMFIKTIFHRLSDGKSQGLFYHLYRLTENSLLGRIRIRKNLHDIITVLAVKK
jgi:2-polyprenyl-3-methyl-5-hydroxy-6-metoxy-1,4-benzoquinol methylase